jgi:hypothetical protein
MVLNYELLNSTFMIFYKHSISNPEWHYFKIKNFDVRFRTINEGTVGWCLEDMAVDVPQSLTSACARANSSALFTVNLKGVDNFQIGDKHS